MSKKVFETFNPLNTWREDQLTAKEPWCFNGMVGIRKYRVTYEEVLEPKEVLIARLRKLWLECDNHHHWQPLQRMAATLEIELDTKDAGINRPKRKK